MNRVYRDELLLIAMAAAIAGIGWLTVGAWFAVGTAVGFLASRWVLLLCELALVRRYVFRNLLEPEPRRTDGYCDCPFCAGGGLAAEIEARQAREARQSSND